MQAKPLRRSRPGAGGGTEEGQRGEGGGGGRRGGRGRPTRWEKGQRKSGKQQFRGPEGSRRWRPLPPRGSHPCPAAGIHDRPLFSPSATRPFPRPLRASSLSPPPHPPSSRPFPQPLGHSLVPLGARSGDGAILGSRGSRAPGSGRQRAASTRDLRTADQSAQYGGGRLLGLPGGICCTSLLLSGHRPGEGLKHLCPVRWSGESPGRDQVPLLVCDGKRNKNPFGYGSRTLPTTHWFTSTNFSIVT